MKLKSKRTLSSLVALRALSGLFYHKHAAAEEDWKTRNLQLQGLAQASVYDAK